MQALVGNQGQRSAASSLSNSTFLQKIDTHSCRVRRSAVGDIKSLFGSRGCGINQLSDVKKKRRKNRKLIIISPATARRQPPGRASSLFRRGCAECSPLAPIQDHRSTSLQLWLPRKARREHVMPSRRFPPTFGQRTVTSHCIIYLVRTLKRSAILCARLGVTPRELGSETLAVMQGTAGFGGSQAAAPYEWPLGVGPGLLHRR